MIRILIVLAFVASLAACAQSDFCEGTTTLREQADKCNDAQGRAHRARDAALFGVKQ